MDSIIVNISASGIVNHTPFTLKNLGSTLIPIIIKTNVLKNDIIADVFQSENAVNIPDAKIKIIIK